MKKLFFIIMLISLPLYSLHSQTIFEDFEDISKFSNNKAELAQMKVQSVKGYKGKGIQINYDLTKDHFVEISRSAAINFQGIQEFSWYWKGDANGNLIEIKFVDEDGTQFGTKLPIININKNKWKKYTLPMKILHYLWDGDEKVDKIKSFCIAISRGIPKQGYLIIDEFSYTKRKHKNPYFEIHLNQVGYHPTDHKFFIVRVYDVSLKENIKGTFVIRDKHTNKKIYSETLKNISFTNWKGRFLKGSFNKLQSFGEYYIEVKLKIKKQHLSKKSHSFIIKDILLSSITLPLQLNYLHYQRCGIRCHKNDPVLGGYHDTLFDLSKRMWSIPSLVYGLALYVQDSSFHPDKDNNGLSDDFEELLWGFQFVSKIPEPDGTVSWSGIEADFKKFMTYKQYLTRIGPLHPEEDDLPRMKFKDKDFYATSHNLIALVKALPLIKKKDKKLAKKAEAVVLKSWTWIDKQRLYEARDYGFYIWAACELYKYTHDKKFLYKINKVAPKLLKLQALNYNQFENYTCGDFYTSQKSKDFKYQYKYVYLNFAINMALINLCEIFSQNDPLWFDVYYANKVFGENYLKGISTITPYKQAACGLESFTHKGANANINDKWEYSMNSGSLADLKYKSIDGKNILDLKFNLNKGSWVQIYHKINNNLTGLKTIRFKYKYIGQNNYLEVKLNDQDNSTFAYNIKLSASNHWILKEINISKLKYLFGGDKILDIKALKEIWFAVSKIKGGQGHLFIKEIELIKNNKEIIEVPIVNPNPDDFYYLNCFAGKEAEKSAAANHGLNCDHLALAYIAMKWGQYINDLELEEFADNQMNWVLGANPLDYCMLIGAGTINPIIMAEYYGKPKLKGIIPNGIVGGFNEEPEWWGDTASSGEDWLPHNAAYLALLSVIDNPAEINGQILYNGNPVSKASITLYNKKKKVKNIKTDKYGKFKFEKLVPQTQYKLIIKKGKKRITEIINLLSGSKKELTWDLNRNFNIKIIPPRSIKIGKENIFTVKVTKNAIGENYRIRVKGADIKNQLKGKIQKSKFKIVLIPDGIKPLLFRFEIKGKPLIYKEVYFKFL